MANYYGISTKTDDAAEADREWDREFREKWTYKCNHARKGYPLDVKLQYIGADLPYNFVDAPADINFATKEFLMALDKNIAEYFEFGHLYGPDGKMLEDRFTFRERDEKYSIIVRGGIKSTRAFCQVCGSFLYLPMPPSRIYIMQQDLTDSQIYVSRWPGLVVTEKVFNRLSRWTKYRKKSQLEIFKIPVLTEPRDGLPVDLKSLKPGDFIETPPFPAAGLTIEDILKKKRY